jgi:hypothetical protein
VGVLLRLRLRSVNQSFVAGLLTTGFALRVSVGWLLRLRLRSVNQSCVAAPAE